MTDEILEQLHAAPPKDKRTRCYTKDWLEGLTPERREAFQGALSLSSGWKTASIYEVAKNAGFEKQYNVLRSHRAGSCSCG